MQTYRFIIYTLYICIYFSNTVHVVAATKMQNKHYCVSALVQISAGCIDQSELMSNLLFSVRLKLMSFSFFWDLYLFRQSSQRAHHSLTCSQRAAPLRGASGLFPFTHLGI